VTRFYLRHGRGRPRFVWVDSPAAALEHTAGIPGHDDLHAWLRPRPPTGRPPVAVDLAAGWSRLLAALDDTADHPDLEPPARVRKGDRPWPWPVLPPVPAIEAGVPLRVVLRQGVREALRTALPHGVALPVRAALGPPARLPVCWYGQQDGSWIAHHDVLRRLAWPGPRPATPTASTSGPPSPAPPAGDGPARRSASWSSARPGSARSRCPMVRRAHPRVPRSATATAATSSSPGLRVTLHFG
jgi:hypothetical protein